VAHLLEDPTKVVVEEVSLVEVGTEEADLVEAETEEDEEVGMHWLRRRWVSVRSCCRGVDGRLLQIEVY
jgi:hypothetical protein